MKNLSNLHRIVLITIMLSITAYPTLTVSASSQPIGFRRPNIARVNHSVPAIAEVLSVITNENVTIFANGSSLITLLTIIPSSALADIYRKSLAAPADVEIDEETAIPENMTEIFGAGENITETVIPVREKFCRAIGQEQRFFLGKTPEIFDSEMVPRGSSNDFKVSATAYVSLQVVNVTEMRSDTVWEIGIGPISHSAINASARFVFSKITFIQMMLRSLTGEQIYDYSWTARIKLPVGASLLNGDTLDGSNWAIDFGGGTYMVASMSVDETSTVILNERTLVTENSISTTPEYFLEAFSAYKVFNIRYLLPESTPICLGTETLSEDDWSYSWDYPLWSDSIELSFSEGPISAVLTVTPSLTISGYVGWDFDLGGLSWFEGWMSVTASISVEFEASVTASYSYTFSHTLFEWKSTYSFWVGPVPVWADLQFTSSASFTVSAYAKVSFSAQAQAQATFKAGVRWARDIGWSDISDITASASRTGPNISAEAGASMRPAVHFRLAFLFYGVAGPFIECETYVNAAITYVLPNGSWEVSVSFRIIAGATFAGWLKDFLGLDDWSTVIYERLLASWNGTWGPSSISITETLSPSTVLTYGSVQVYGTATFSGGSPVSLTDVAIIITQTGARWITTTDNSGYYSEYISAPSSAGGYSVRVEIKAGPISGSNSQPLTVQSRSGGGSYSFYRSTTCKGVQGSSPYDPIDETDAFRASDSIAWTWVHLTYVYRSLNVKWEWYKPDGSYYATATYVIPDPASYGYAYWEWYKCWGGIYINGYVPQDVEGRWASKVYIDEGSGYQLKAIEDFVIRYEVTQRTMAKDVQTTDPYEPINPTNLFLNTDPKALGWIRLDEVAEQLEVKWEWYEPSGTTPYFTFYYTVPDPSSQGALYWDWYKFWGYIYIYGYQPQSKLGLWQMKAYIKDVYGNWDLEYSEYFTISDNTPPGTPGTPIDDGVYSTSGTATWTWTAAPEDGTVVQYQIQVGTTPGGNDVYDGYIGTSLSKTLNSLLSGLTYYARVRAMNQAGQWGPWSGVSDGITVDRPPMTLITSGPKENIDYVDVCFNWTGSDDITPISSLVYSYYLVGYDSDWSPFTSSTSKQYNGLPDNIYTFKVRAKDLLGSIDPSPAEVSFTIKRIIFLESREDAGATANLGTIILDGTLYGLPGNIPKAVGNYQVQYNASLGYVFTHWETVGGVKVENTATNPTTVTISRNGTLRAIYKEEILRVHNLNTGFNYTTIQKAIDAPETLGGHTIKVDAGTYYEHINLYKSLMLIGQSNETTIIDGGEIGNVINVTADNIEIGGFTIQNSGTDYNSALYISGSYATVSKNVIMHNLRGFGIKVENSHGNNISRNVVVDTWCGIHLHLSDLNNISGNILVNNEAFGISLSSASNNYVGENLLENCSYVEVQLLWSHLNVIIGNYITRAISGIWLGYSNNNFVSENTITNSGKGTGEAIGFGKDCSNNVISKNNIINNKNGIYAYSTTNNNTIFHNNFINNTFQLAPFNPPIAGAVWENGYPSGGNYWSDYNGTDFHNGPYQNETGSDGIGDTPYVIGENNIDRYPLMKPYGVQHDIGITSITPSKTIIGQGYTLQINIRIVNYGVNAENFNVTFYANTTITETKEVTLANGNSTTITFAWNTTGFAKGNYTITAYTWPVPGETDTLDNNYTFSGFVFVTIAGDVTSQDGPPDGTCDMRDIGTLCSKFMTTPSSQDWNQNYDINDDGIVDMRDIGIACNNFMKDP